VNGIGVDFGSGQARAAYCLDGMCAALPERVWVPGGEPVIRLYPGQQAWLAVDTPKASLGARKSGPDAGRTRKKSHDQAVLDILKTLRAKVEGHLNAKILGAAIGVPSCYGVNQRALLRSIGEAAGFGTVALVDESTAAAIATYRGVPETRNVLVYALGRSVFCASVLTVGSEQTQARCHEGSMELGGTDFDVLLVRVMASTVSRKTGIDIRTDRKVILDLLSQAEKAKIELCTSSQYDVEVGPGIDSTGQAFHRQLRLTRDEVEELFGPLVHRTVALSQKAIAGAGLEIGQIDEILLVGASTRMPLVMREIQRSIGRRMRHAPEDAIACGAALYAAARQNCFVGAAQYGTEAAQPAGTDEPGEPIEEPGSGAPEEPEAVVMALEPDDQLLQTLMAARRKVAQGQLDASIETFQDFLRQAQEELSYIYSKRSAELRQEGRYAEATDMLEQGLACFPENRHIRRLLSEIHYQWAYQYARHGEMGACRRALRKSLNLDPENAPALRLMQELPGSRHAASRTRRKKPGRGR
jgi:actin-like ATPase involved in cell morphogenesis